MLKIQEIYHERLREAISLKFAKVFSQATPGTCLKILGLSLADMIALRELLMGNFPEIQMVILSDVDRFRDGFVSATHLIELRNNSTQPLLALIPSGLQTPAEDSYGNATFNDLDISNIDKDILDHLKQQIPPSIFPFVKITEQFALADFNQVRTIYFLLALQRDNWSKEAIGLHLDYFGLIPDSYKTDNTSEWRVRLVYNQQCSCIVSNFSDSIPERIVALPISPDTNQREIANFLNNADTKDKFELMHEIHNSPDFDKLDFARWQLPKIENRSLLKIFVGELSSKEMQYEGTDKTLKIKQGKNVALKIRIATEPIPKDFPALKAFRILLISTDGWEEVGEVRKIKVTEGSRGYRDVTLKISAVTVEQGTYFFRIVGEDESSAPLNTVDDFQSEQMQELWTKERATGADYQEFKDSHQAKTTNETEDIRLQFIEADDDDDDAPTAMDVSRKDKINNAMQAYFRYRIDELKHKKEVTFPQTTPDTALWQSTSGAALQDTFLLKLGTLHNYQILVSSKLRELERLFLENFSEIGKVDCTLHVNSTNAGFPYKEFFPFSTAGLEKLLELRGKIFVAIMKSAPKDSGIFETFLNFCDPQNIELIREYVNCYRHTVEVCKSKKDSIETLMRLQNLDIIDLQAQVDDGRDIHVKLLPPIHPLRLAWFVDLYDLFSAWEIKTLNNKKHKQEWTRDLVGLFLGDIYPSNNSLILTGNSYSYYQYAGELTFGWGIFFETENKKANLALSNERQIKIYIAELLNLPCEVRIDSDVSQSLIEKYIQNYLKQHPYSSKIIINIFNPGDGASFVKAIIALEQKLPNQYQYEFRLCCEDDFVIPGEAFRELMNPESNISDKAENFSTVAANRLFPKIRFSLNKVSDFKKNPFDFVANLSFLINPFSAKCELLPVDRNNPSDALNGLIVKSISTVKKDQNVVRWMRTVYCDEGPAQGTEFFYQGNRLLNRLQQVTSIVINPQETANLYPGVSVCIDAPEKILLSLIHDCSDWVITFDRSIGPEIFDSKNESGENPYLLDYIPSWELNGISAFLTTKPEMEAYRFLYPYLKKIGLENICDNENLLRILEDIRTISGSLLLQAISTNNRAFEVIGMALTKRVLEKKNYLDNAFLIPLDLHRDLFNLPDQDTRERADLLVVQCDPATRELHIDVVEIKCRASLDCGESQDELLAKVSGQINHSIEAFKKHFEISLSEESDRIDRLVKCLELRNLLEFYIKRARRFGQLSESAEKHYIAFCGSLAQGYNLTFNKIELIYNFSAENPYEKEDGEDFTRYIIGKSLISEVVKPDGDLNTFRLENSLRHFELPLNVPQLQPEEIEKYSEADDLPTSKPESEKAGDFSGINNEEHAGSSTAKAAAPREKDIEKEISVHEPVGEQVIPICYDTIIGNNSTSVAQVGALGIQKINNKKIALDLAKTSAISLFGVQGAGKSYTIGTVTEMVLKQMPNINQLPSPLAGVIFHYSESMDYSPEFTSMMHPNDNQGEVQALLDFYNAQPDSVQDIILLTPKDKVEERKQQYPNIEVFPIAFSSKELNVASWLFLLGAVGNDSMYIKQIRATMKAIRNDLTLENIRSKIQKSSNISDESKKLAETRFQLAEEYINDDISLKSVLQPGRLVIVDLRDEFIEKDDALKLFVVMLNVYSGVETINGQRFNKFIVFDEAHKYMDSKELSSTIATAIKEMRHKGVSIMIASQDPTGLPSEIIELSSILIMHRFNSPAWLKHIQKAITQTAALTPADLAGLKTGEAFVWANESSDTQITNRPVKIKTRPRATKHGGTTINATDTHV